MLRDAHYVRVSTDGQRERDTIRTQGEALAAISSTAGAEVVGVYPDNGVSGATTNRPALNRLLADAKERKFDRVLVWAQDRLGRADVLQMLLLRNELRLQGIPLIEGRTGRDFTAEGDASELVYLIEAWSANKERGDILERTRRGKRKAVSQGRFGGGIRPYGFDVDQATKRLMINPEQAEAVRLMYFWTVKDDLSAKRIADRLNALGYVPKEARNPRRRVCGLWTEDRVRQTLRNPVYRGEYIWGRRSRAGANEIPLRAECTAIVSPADWAEAQTALDSRRTTSGPRDPLKYPLTGLVRCSECGRPMSGQDQKGIRYYRCQGVLSRVPVESRCRARSVRAEHVESGVWRYIESILSQPQYVSKYLSGNQNETVSHLVDELERTRRGIAEVMREMRNLTRCLATTEGGLIAESIRADMASVAARHETLVRQEKEQLSAIAQVERGRQLAVKAEAAIALLRASLRVPRDSQRCEVMRLLVSKIEVGSDEPRITCWLRVPVTEDDSHDPGSPPPIGVATRAMPSSTSRTTTGPSGATAGSAATATRCRRR
jgi:site-specific DNA recombinase